MKILLGAPTEMTVGLSEAMRRRRTSRSFACDALANDEVATILWACCGITDSKGHRTVPTTRNLKAVSVYLLDERGVWRYDETEGVLDLVKAEDVRSESSEGQKELVSEAPVTLVFVSDLEKAGEARATGPYVDAGCMAQNAYLAACALGLSCVVRASFNPEGLAAAMNLGADELPVLTFTVGRPKKN